MSCLAVHAAPDALDQAAAAHVAHALVEYGLPIDPEVWAAAVRAHLEPLPADRPWRKHRARLLVVPVAVTVPPAVRAVRAAQVSLPRCPLACAELHAHDDAAGAA